MYAIPESSPKVLDASATPTYSTFCLRNWPWFLEQFISVLNPHVCPFAVDLLDVVRCLYSFQGSLILMGVNGSYAIFTEYMNSDEQIQQHFQKERQEILGHMCTYVYFPLCPTSIQKPDSLL